jgi:maltooligosyltrehalose trehalohydrolase
VETVRRGRQEEFAAFARQGSPPDPQAEETFISAKLDQEQRYRGDRRVIFDFYRDLIRLRNKCAPFVSLSREDMQVVACEEESVLAVIRSADSGQVFCLFNYSDQSRVIRPPLASGRLQILLDSTGDSPPGSCITVDTARPETFPTLAPFGVIVYKKE